MSADQVPERPVTIYTVAQRAGVSIATVSRVLRGSTPASANTRRKVLRAVEELDYVPLRAARQVELPRHEAHGFVLPGLIGPYYSELLSGFESTAAQYGQSVSVVIGGGSVNLETSLRKVLPRVDGVVIANDTVSDAFVRWVVSQVPTVTLARSPIEGCDAVLVENQQSAAALTDHLIDHGRTRLVFVGTPEESHDISERYLGFQQTVSRRAAVEALEPIRVRYEEASAQEVVERYLLAERGIDALICANDELALATMALLAREGIAVPDEVAIVGFDDIMTSRYVAPGLTTVQQPTRALGRWAAIRLHERIQGRRFDVHPQVLPTKIVVRGSCGCRFDEPILPAAYAGRAVPLLQADVG